MLFFLVESETRILSFAPTSGPVGTELRIFGTGLGGGTGAAVGDVPLTGFTVISDNEVRGTIAAGTTNGFVALTNPGGTATSTAEFIVSTAGAGNLLLTFNTWQENQRTVPFDFADAATVALNLQESQHFYGTLSQDTTFSWSNLQSGMSWQVQITATATRTITWPVGIQWRGSQPAVQAGVTLIQFTTLDGTTVWGG